MTLRAALSAKLVALKRSHNKRHRLRSSSRSGWLARYGSPRSMRSFSELTPLIVTAVWWVRPAPYGSFMARELAIDSSDRGGGPGRSSGGRDRPRFELVAPRRLHVLAGRLVEADRRDLRDRSDQCRTGTDR